MLDIVDNQINLSSMSTCLNVFSFVRAVGRRSRMSYLKYVMFSVNYIACFVTEMLFYLCYSRSMTPDVYYIL